MKLLLIALVVLASQAALAKECFLAQQVRNFKAIDHSTVEIDAGRNDYVLELGICQEIEWAHKIAFDSFGGSRVCRGDRLLVLDTFSNHVKQSCFIHNITKIVK